jgi:hypothetical protein
MSDPVPELDTRGIADTSLERLRDRLEAIGLQSRELLFGAGDQVRERDGRRAEPGRVQFSQRPPQRELAVHADTERLELDDPAERRIAPELAVELQPRELLSAPASEDLDPVNPHIQDTHDLQKRPAVRVNLIGKVRQENAVAGITVAPSSTPCQLTAGRRTSKMVVEIDRQQHFTQIV